MSQSTARPSQGSIPVGPTVIRSIGNKLDPAAPIIPGLETPAKPTFNFFDGGTTKLDELPSLFSLSEAVERFFETFLLLYCREIIKLNEIIFQKMKIK